MDLLTNSVASISVTRGPAGVSSALQRLDSFPANQVQTMIISCVVSLHPHQTLRGWETAANHRPAAVRRAVAWMSPSLAILHSLRGHGIEAGAHEQRVLIRAEQGDDCGGATRWTAELCP